MCESYTTSYKVENIIELLKFMVQIQFMRFSTFFIIRFRQEKQEHLYFIHQVDFYLLKTHVQYHIISYVLYNSILQYNS
jgi:hypothetical protein